MSIKSAIGSFVNSCETVVNSISQSSVYKTTNNKLNTIGVEGAKILNNNFLVRSFDSLVTNPLANFTSETMVSTFSKAGFREPAMTKHRLLTISYDANTVFLISNVALLALGVISLNPITLAATLVAGRVLGKTLQHPTTDGLATTAKRFKLFFKNPRETLKQGADGSAEAAKLAQTTCGRRLFGIFKVIA